MDANCVTCRRTFDQELSNDSKRCPLCLLADGILVDDGKDFLSTPTRTHPFTVSELNELFPDLEVIEKIGSGGMGEVYLAIQKTLNREVALKILRPEFSTDLEVCERFDREARVMASLSHPNIVTIYEFGHREGFQYLIIEYVEGKSLAEHLWDGPLNIEMGLSLIRQISLAVGYAHSKGVLHRDIKPGNVLVSTDEVAKIADFGLAKILRDDVDLSLTVKNAGMGTPRYMAPEQSSSAKESDEKADIFSMAMVFHEMMTGHLPIGKTINISKRIPGLKKFDRLIRRSLDPDPKARPESALEFESSISSPKLTDSLTPVKKPCLLPALLVTGILITLSLVLYTQSIPSPTPVLHQSAESVYHPVPFQLELPAGPLWNWRCREQAARKVVGQFSDFEEVEISPYFPNSFFGRRANGEFHNRHPFPPLECTRMLTASLGLSLDNKIFHRPATNKPLIFRPHDPPLPVSTFSQGADYAIALTVDQRIYTAATDLVWSQRGELLEKISAIKNVVKLDTWSHNGILLKSDGSIVTWNTRRNSFLQDYPPEIKWKDVACGVLHYVGIDVYGNVSAWPVDPDSEDKVVHAAIAVPKSIKRGAVRVKAESTVSAVQHHDGTWTAWGHDFGHGLVERINRIGPAKDIAFRTHPPKATELYWIEPISQSGIDVPRYR